MCTGLEIATVAGAVAGTAGAATAYESSRRQRNMQRDAVAAAKAADTKATQDANSRIAMRRRALANNSLMTGGGESSGIAAMGRTTLGGS